MKTFLLLILFAISQQVDAQQVDTTAYQTQRLKVNALLNQRSAKFGQYDQSLDTRTGIFGFQTKSDVKNSNEILRQIVLNDNNIFKELKILMEYKDQEVIAAKNTASEVNGRMLNYMQSIKKLQEENERLKSANQTTSLAGSAIYIILFLIAALIGTYFYFQNKLKTLTNSKGPF
ncbi:MAG TPA: hypothetical protein VF679_02110 [Pedobacter sp.]|jgi:hypothetical protein